MDGGATEAQKFVWQGAIPLQIHLHESEVTALPAPPPLMVLAPRIGYLPLLASQLKPHFGGALPPGTDTIWFEYKGLPLKWYVPIGVIFDLLCTEPERPWNLTVHFRGYPSNILTPYESEESVKWSFINSLKEAAYIINGNCKNIMKMAQSDQVDLWNSISNRNLEAYMRISSKLKLRIIDDDFTENSISRSSGETDSAGPAKTGRVPIRLYVWTVSEDFEDVEDAPQVDDWEKVSYVNRPVEYQNRGKYFSLGDAVKSLLPNYFKEKSQTDSETKAEVEGQANPEEGVSKSPTQTETTSSPPKTKLMFVRVQGIQPKLEIPFSWAVNNLMSPDYFLHLCVCVKVSQ
ncbi:unnamed protein product [Rhodiola kirilowii]